MNILIAVDSFKDSMTSVQASDVIIKGLSTKKNSFDLKVVPMADGGEGTVESLVRATKGQFVSKTVHDPLMREVEASYGILGDRQSAIIEMASASGIELLSGDERNPWITSTYGTGELMIDAINHGVEQIIVGLGGSATNDCGAGMAQALGVSFTDKNGREIDKGGGALGNVHNIDFSGIDKRIQEVSITVACDVTNPLTGKSGASQIYGPQKGADTGMIIKLDRNLEHFANKIKEFIGKDINNLPGAGAAGGLGAGLVAFAGASLKPGFEIISEITNLEDQIKWCDLVITGEGKIDYQTKFGKTPIGVSRLAKKYKKPVIVIAGTIGRGYEELYDEGITAIYSIVNGPISLDEAIKNGPDLLRKLSINLARTLALKR